MNQGTLPPTFPPILPTLTPTQPDIPYALLLLITMVIAALGNLTVIVIILHHYQMRTHTNALVASLSFSDLLPASFLLPVTAVSLLTPHWQYSREVCIVYGTLQSIYALSATSNVMIIAMDRVVALVQPTGKRLTSSGCGIVMSVSWSLAILLSMPWFYTHSNFNSVDHTLGLNHCVYLLHGATTYNAKFLTWITIITGHTIPILVMLYASFGLWRTVRSGDTKISPVTIEPHVMIFHGEIRTAVTVVMIVCVFVVCWLPYIVIVLLRLTIQRESSALEDSVVLTLCWVSSAVKPVMYVYRNPHIAQLLRLRKLRHHSEISSDSRRSADAGVVVVSEEQVQPKFDWAVVTKSPIAARLLLCGARKDSDLEMFTNVERTNSDDRISTISLN